MTETSAAPHTGPITGSVPAPMFDTGAQPVKANTEPHHAPIFDTGPHPNPLRAPGAPLESRTPSESQAGAAAEPECGAEPQAEAGAGREPKPAAADLEPHPSAPQAFSELDNVDTDAFLRSVTGYIGPVLRPDPTSIPAPAEIPAQPIAVPGSFLFLKRWQFALMVAGVWVLSAAAGLGFYYWWYSSLIKTLPVFGILLYLVVCMVASVLLSMVPNRPRATGLAVAVMAAPLASTAAAAVLHGAYYFEWIARPALG